MKKFNFKKTAASIAAFTLVLSAAVSPNASLISELVPVNSISASAAVSGSWVYTVSDGVAKITDYTGTATTLTIPTTLGGYPVKHILGGAFQGNTTLQYVKISEGVEKIYARAFMGCTSLNTVSLPSTLKEINDNAFKNTALGDIVIPANVEKLGTNAFGTSSLKTATIKGNTKVNSAFFSATNLAKVTFDKNYISNFTTAFSNNKNLRYINNSAIVYAITKGELCVNQTYIDIIKNLDNNTYVKQYIADRTKRIVSSVTTSSMTDYQKAKALHDWICEKVVYDHDNKDAKKNHVDSSIFLNDSTVCEGYARGYALLLQAAGIEAYYVTGNTENAQSHAWNVVKLGGHYFHIDVCWDDLANGYYYKYFLKSEKYINQYKWHKNTLVEKPSDLYNYAKGVTTPTCNYSLGDINKNGVVDKNDSQYILNYTVKMSGYTISANDKVLADTNFDGVIDILDVITLNKMINS